jgi:hypothetical protein
MSLERAYPMTGNKPVKDRKKNNKIATVTFCYSLSSRCHIYAERIRIIPTSATLTRSTRKLDMEIVDVEAAQHRQPSRLRRDAERPRVADDFEAICARVENCAASASVLTSQCYRRATRRDGSPVARPLSLLLSARG